MIDIHIKNLGHIMSGKSTLVERHDQFDVNNNFVNKKNIFAALPSMWYLSSLTRD